MRARVSDSPPFCLRGRTSRAFRKPDHRRRQHNEEDADNLPALRIERRLTAAQLQVPAEISPEAEWFANLNNVQTRRVYEADQKHFMVFVRI